MQLIWFGTPGEKLPPKGSYQEGELQELHGTDAACAYRVATKHEVIDGRRMPRWLELEELIGAHNVLEPTFYARIELVHRHTAEGKHLPPIPRITHLGFRDWAEGRELRTADLSRARDAAYKFYAAFCAELTEDGEPVYRTSIAEESGMRDFVETRRTGRQRLKTDDYQRAAQVYRDNFDGTPTQAVADAFGVGIRQGGNIVSECRRRGFLPPTKQGKKKA